MREAPVAASPQRGTEVANRNDTGELRPAPWPRQAIENCDTLFLVGTSFPYIEFLPEPGQARGVQLDLDATRIGLRYPVEVGLVGHCQATLRALLPLLRKKEDRSFLQAAREGMREWTELMLTWATAKDEPMKPQVVAHPGRQVVAFAGDGGFSMLMAEFATAVKYKLPVKVVVVKNNTLGMIRWEQMVFLGNPEYGCELQPIDFAKFAAACGADGFTCDDPAEIGGVLDAALASPGPALVEAVVDPHEPPMPPKATAEQAYHLAKALARGTRDRGAIITTVLKNKVREMV
jgi:pyruvate dehydrogenase (quinone)/pyruvate oxidase